MPRRRTRGWDLLGKRRWSCYAEVSAREAAGRRFACFHNLEMLPGKGGPTDDTARRRRDGGLVDRATRRMRRMRHHAALIDDVDLVHPRVRAELSCVLFLVQKRSWMARAAACWLLQPESRYKAFTNCLRLVCMRRKGGACG